MDNEQLAHDEVVANVRTAIELTTELHNVLQWLLSTGKPHLYGRTVWALGEFAPYVDVMVRHLTDAEEGLTEKKTP